MVTIFSKRLGNFDDAQGTTVRATNTITVQHRLMQFQNEFA